MLPGLFDFFSTSPMEKATQQQTKEHNTNLVLSTIFERASISRAEISRITSLTRTTVSDIVADLIMEGLVKEIGAGPSLGGKSPILLSLVQDSRYLIGVDLGYDEFNGAIVDLRGHICEKITLPIDSGCTGEKAIAEIYHIVDQLVQSKLRPLIGIGLGAPGVVNTREGLVVRAVNLDWKNVPLARMLRERYQLPVYILNDSHSAALGEFSHQSGLRSSQNLVAINVRRGIGSGIIINGQLFQGDGGGAGEIGHVVVISPDGQPCLCGNSGCLETVASRRAVLARYAALSGKTVTLEQLEQAFQAGDELARQAIVESGQYIGMAVQSLIGTLNIERIVMVGDLNRFGAPWLEAIKETAARSTFYRLAQDTQIEIGTAGKNGIIEGAALFLLKDYSLLFRHAA
jgi:N-acetylglucosamine repressor